MAKTPLPLDFSGDQLVQGSSRAASKAPHVQRGDFWYVPREQIRVLDGFNMRVDTPTRRAVIRRLANLIKENGFDKTKPLTVYAGKDGADDVFFLTDGHTRLAAAELAASEGFEGVAKLPVIAHERGTDLKELTAALYTANDGEKPSPLETGIICQRLAKLGCDDAEMARRLGLTQKWIRDVQMLVAAPAKILDLVEAGKISASVAMDALREHGSDALAVLTEAQGEAKAAGKEKATKKHVKKAAAKRAPVKKGSTVRVPRSTRPTDIDFFRAAIDYALDHVTGDGMVWLRAWNRGDADEVAELEIHMGQPEGAMNDQSKRKAVKPRAEQPAAEQPEETGAPDNLEGL